MNRPIELVEELRERVARRRYAMWEAIGDGDTSLMEQAADEIERLRGVVEHLCCETPVREPQAT